MNLKKLSHYFTLFLLGIGLLLYLPSLRNHFVWDDEEQVVANQAVHSLQNIPSLFAGSTFNSGGAKSLGGLYYKPLMSLSFATLYTLFGTSPWAFHLFQILLHLGSTLLVFWLFCKMLTQPKLAFALALIFLVHPLNVETVVYISSLQDTLYLFFGLLGLYALARPKKLFYRHFLASGLCLFLALMGKETGLLFGPLTVLYLALFRTKKTVLAYLLTSGTALGTYLYLRLCVAHVYLEKNHFTPIATLPLVERLQSLPAIFWHYLTGFIFPSHLAISEHWVVNTLSWANFYLPLLFLIVIVALWLYTLLRLKSKVFWFFSLWFGLAIGFHLQLFPLDLTVADRWFYLPMIGLLGSIGSAWTFIPGAKSFSRSDPVGNPARSDLIGLSILGIVIAALCIRSSIRIQNWHDGLTLYTHDIRLEASSFDLTNNYGVELFRAGRLPEAKAQFIRSTEISPTWWTNWNNLGVVVENEGQLDLALFYYDKAIKQGSYYLAYGNYGRVLLKQNKLKEARIFLEASLSHYPNNETLQALAQYLVQQENISKSKFSH